MFERVLVPVDLTDKNRAAVDAAAELARGHAASITLLHVIETIQGAAYEEFEDFYATLTERAEAALRKWSEELSSRGLSVEREIVFGKRGAEIIRFAHDRSCDLVVLSSHAVDREHPGAGLGTISHQVALFAPLRGSAGPVDSDCSSRRPGLPRATQ